MAASAFSSFVCHCKKQDAVELNPIYIEMFLEFILTKSNLHGQGRISDLFAQL
jgi:hypothetical protein